MLQISNQIIITNTHLSFSSMNKLSWCSLYLYQHCECDLVSLCFVGVPAELERARGWNKYVLCEVDCDVNLHGNSSESNSHTFHVAYKGNLETERTPWQ